MKWANGRVLILDDDATIGRGISLLAEHLEVDAISVCHPNDFFATIDQWNPTHIILDLVMPEMDGVEVLQLLAGNGCVSRIAISSSMGQRILNATKQSAAEHGLDVVCVLPKPLTMKSLKEFLFSPIDLSVATVAQNRSETVITKVDLLDAIARREFCLVFQPKIHCKTRDLVGFEVLVRWEHPSKGLIMPDHFIPLSERLGLIGLITDQIVEQALNWYARTAAVHGLSVSINVSAKTLGDIDFADWLDDMCQKAGIPNDVIVLEVTETAAVVNQLSALDMFTRLRLKGFQVSIDDFGIGNSSLAMLARLPFSEIKVDKSFAMKAGSNEECRAIIRSTVSLGHGLNLTVVAEGVEDEATLNFLSEIGCELAQGYHIARPMPGGSILDWMAQRDCACTKCGIEKDSTMLRMSGEIAIPAP